MNPKLIKKAIIIELISLAILIVTTAGALLYALLGPDTIPTHYDFAGNIDGYGSPFTLLIMPITMLFCNGLIAFSIHLISPAKWNMPFKVKEGREVKVYRDIAEMSAKMELLLSIYALLMTITMMFQQAVIMIALSFWLMVGIVVVFATSMSTMKRHNK